MAKTRNYLTTRNWTAVDAHFRKGGAHGGTRKQRAKRDRTQTKQQLRKGDYDG